MMKNRKTSRTKKEVDRTAVRATLSFALLPIISPLLNLFQLDLQPALVVLEGRAEALRGLLDGIELPYAEVVVLVLSHQVLGSSSLIVLYGDRPFVGNLSGYRHEAFANKQNRVVIMCLHVFLGCDSSRGYCRPLLYLLDAVAYQEIDTEDDDCDDDEDSHDIEQVVVECHVCSLRDGDELAVLDVAEAVSDDVDVEGLVVDGEDGAFVGFAVEGELDVVGGLDAAPEGFAGEVKEDGVVILLLLLDELAELAVDLHLGGAGLGAGGDFGLVLLGLGQTGGGTGILAEPFLLRHDGGMELSLELVEVGHGFDTIEKPVSEHSSLHIRGRMEIV